MHSRKESTTSPADYCQKAKATQILYHASAFLSSNIGQKRKDGSNVENILRMLYNLPCEKIHAQDAPFVRTARIKNEHLELLSASMSDEQKDLLDAYLDASCKVEDMMDFDRFRFAFHFGAQLMAELIEGKGDAL